LLARQPLRPRFALASNHGYGLRGGISRKYFPESWKTCRFSAFPRIRAGEEERHPEMPFARSRPGIRPSGGFVAHLAIDHQMTPPSHGPLTALRAPEALSFGSAVGHAFGGPPS